MWRRNRFSVMVLVVGVAAAAAAAPACSRPREAPANTVGSSTSSSSNGDSGAEASSDGGEAAATNAASFVEPPPTCEDAANVTIFSSPATPSVGAPVRVLAVSDKPLTGELRAAGAAAASDARRGGPPYFWMIEIAAPAAGPLNVSFVQRACAEGQNASALKLDVKKNRAGAPAPPKDGLWPARGAWTHSLENLYSAWIEALFDAPDSEQPSWPALHEVLRDPKRNWLFDHLSASEDSGTPGKVAPVIRPDCADLPYFLRAYFAWKMRLPFGLAECNRGGGGAPPSCKNLITNEDPDERADAKKADGSVAAFGAFLRGTLADKAHSGSARTPFEDEVSDYYPVKLSWESLRPGTVYADPYGHVLVIAKRLPQTAERGGVLYAVDGQPDGTVARKRFWRGNFLYANKRELGGPGFKHFRPVVRKAGHLARLGDDGIKSSADYGDVSRDPGKLDVEGFYDAMDDVLSPQPLDPTRAMMETISALEEQVKTRVQSVDNGRKWLAQGKGLPATMPDGAEIFETNGAWEDFSTPSRDLRLLIAIDVVRGFPARVARRPERYAMPRGKSPKDVEADLAKVLERELKGRSVTYTKTDGSPLTLTLQEVLTRSNAFEMTYNPNDCVETRWAAPAGSPEASTCRSQAPADQRTRMETYRAWFHDRQRPPRK